MANLRDLKKNVNFITDEVLDACFIHQQLSSKDEKDVENTNEIIADVIHFRNDIITKINNPSDDDKKNLKKFYSSILKDMIVKAEESIDKLDSKNK